MDMYKKNYFNYLFPLFAFWPVWIWYLQRITDGSDEPWGIFALLTAIIFVLTNKETQINSGGSRFAFFSPSTGVILVYILSYHYFPPMLHAVLVVLWIALQLGQINLGMSFHLGIFGLLFLSLPIIASLQFFLGYPIRLVTTHIASHIIGLTGYAVVAQGTMLAWAGELVAVDAPCAGIRMLWCTLYISFTLSCFFKLSTFQTWLNYFLATVLVFIGNIIRTVILFFLESKILKLPFPAHTLTGLIVFTLVIAAVFTVSSQFKLSRMRA